MQGIFKDSTILEKSVKYQIDGENYILTANYLCEENIAIEKPFDIEVNPDPELNNSESA